ncbi:MAG: cyanophycinase [Bacteroidales bacterium]|nr:cyanophycinase [Bacteroidales bacterium]
MNRLLTLFSTLCILCLPLFTTSCGTTQQQEEIKGHLLIIGGGTTDQLRRKIVELAGGPEDAKILVIPFAAGDATEQAGIRESQRFRDSTGVRADFVAFERGEADLEENLRKLDGITGIFFSGGDQTRLTDVLLGTKFLERIKEIYRQGAVISGNSAGAAVMSEIMITGRELVNTSNVRFRFIREGNVEFTEGFGFIDFAIIDQHFIQRSRQNRLINLVIEHNLPGIGIDENTAVIFSGGGRTFEVYGTRSVMVFEPRFRTSPRTDELGNLSADAIEMRILLSGDSHTLR